MHFQAGWLKITAPASNADPSAVLWNPAGNSMALYVTDIWTANDNSNAVGGTIRRTTARGTPATSQTPDADNNMDNNRSAPASGAVIDLPLWTGGSPTSDASVLFQFHWTQSSSVTELVFPVPIVIPPGTGLGVYSLGTAAPAYWTIGWDE